MMADMKPNYTLLNNWQHWLDSLTPAYKKMVEEEEKSLIKFAKENLSQKSRVLEVGCGTGRLLYLTSQFAGEAVGLEYEYTEIKKAERINKNKKIKFAYSNGTRMPFPDNSFDLEICFFNTLGNQNERKFEVVQEMSRTMKAEGTSMFSVYVENAAPYQLEYYKKGGCKESEINVIGDFIFTDSETMGSFVSERFGRKKLMRLLTDNGFPEVKIRRLADFSYLAYARKFT